ncbi:hypothetical protein BDB00DRAFT_971624 [Zychaea mexicana]|uniref:uncharacterized protein n=1 Tax=Zychaea mexicana TaxID=64656 RepID=UPI0022FE25B7|nr:uncharacterized protein BDB00DRAFT_971624 [Zychaea mexicana]KAI9496523.1 hypothetical protein BDB00DRAFT_971624 [Zychaea mexicana]
MSSRKHSRRDSDDDSKRKHKKSKQKNNDLSDAIKDTIEPISSDDYFEKATEFRLWLREEKDRYFGDLDADDARHYFKKFVKAWNRHDLDEKYYKGINSAQLSSSETTGYRWSFAKQLDQHEIDRIRDNVDTLTNSGKGKRRNVGPAMPSSSSSSTRRFDQVDFEERHERERNERRAERKSEVKRVKSRREEHLDEVAPKETGREAQLAKRRAQNAYHKRERDLDVELDDSDLYGGGRDEFKAKLAAEKRREEARQQRRQQRQEERYGPIQERMAQHKAKENATMEMFRKMAEDQKKRGGL